MPWVTDDEALPAWERDVYALLLTFLRRTDGGGEGSAARPPALFPAFRAAWREAHFSFVLTQTETRPTGLPLDAYIQRLYSLAMERWTQPLPAAAVRAALTRAAVRGGGEPLGAEGLGAAIARWSRHGLDVAAAGVYLLYCLFHAQPGAPTVRVYLSAERQEALLRLLPALAAAGRADAVAAVRRLAAARAFAPGAPRALDAAGGPGAGLLPGAAPPAGAAAAAGATALERDARFQLASCVRGLGAAELAPLCDRYRARLARVWRSESAAAARARGSAAAAAALAAAAAAEPPAWVADLDVGRLLGEYCAVRHEQLQLLASYGKQYGTRKLREARGAAAGGAASPLAAAAGVGLPAAARAAMQRNAARQEDMRRRAAPWAERFGVEVPTAATAAAAVAAAAAGAPGLRGAHSDLALGISGLPELPAGAAARPLAGALPPPRDEWQGTLPEEEDYDDEEGAPETGAAAASSSESSSSSEDSSSSEGSSSSDDSSSLDESGGRAAAAPPPPPPPPSAVKKQRLCAHCHAPGHYKKTCPVLKAAVADGSPPPPPLPAPPKAARPAAKRKAPAAGRGRGPAAKRGGAAGAAAGAAAELLDLVRGAEAALAEDAGL